MQHPPLHTLIAQSRERDRIGDRFHLGFAMLYFFSLPLGATPAAIGLGILAGYSILRIWVTWRIMARVGDSAIFWLILAQAVWLALSLIWSHDRRQGLDEVTMLRCQFLLLLFIWPMIDRAHWLAGGLVVGSLIAFIAQIGQWLGIQWVIDVGFSDAVPGRESGLAHPSLTAVLAVMAGIVVMAGPRRSSTRSLIWRLPAVIAIGISILLTGSRGPWIATLVSWPAAALTLFGKHSGSTGATGRRMRTLGIGSAVLLVLVTCGWFAAGERVVDRIRLLASEVHAAVVDHDYRSDVGARIKQIEISARLSGLHPLLGVGAGSYYVDAIAVYRKDTGVGDSNATPGTRQSSEARVPVRHHPHSALAYAFAVTGIPGGVLYLVFWMVLFAGAIRAARHAMEPLVRVLPAAVGGLFIAFAVDCQNLSMPGISILMLVAAMVMREQITIQDRMQSTNGISTVRKENEHNVA